MGIDNLISKINLIRELLNNAQKVTLAKRDSNWHSQYLKLQMEYKESLQQFKFGIMSNNIKNYGYKKDLISNLFKEGLITENQYKNLKFNNNNAVLREEHPVIYTMSDDDNIIYQIVKTHSKNGIQKPISDELFGCHNKESIKVYEILKGTYVADHIYLFQLKNKSDFNKFIENIEDNEQLMAKFFKNENVRLYQKEKAYEMIFKSRYNKEPIILDEQIYKIDGDFKVVIKPSLIDITNHIYIEDNLDRISNYEDYRTESWMSYLKLYENEIANTNKNDPSDI